MSDEPMQTRETMLREMDRDNTYVENKKWAMENASIVKGLRDGSLVAVPRIDLWDVSVILKMTRCYESADVIDKLLAATKAPTP